MNDWGEEIAKLILLVVALGLLKSGIEYGIENYVKPGRWDMAAYESKESYDPVFYKEYRTEELCNVDGKKFLADKVYVSYQCSKNCKYVSDSEGEYAICE